MASKEKDEPYCAFKDDKFRLLALVSRDVKHVVVIGLLAVIIICFGGHAAIAAAIIGLVKAASRYF